MASAAPPVLKLDELLKLLPERGWSTSVILTPTATSWIQAYGVANNWDVEVRSEPDLPLSRGSLPVADAVLAAPLTFNTLNQWASGVSNSLALGVLNELLGASIAITAVPCAKTALRAHPAYAESISLLSAAGVELLDPDEVTFRDSDGLVNFRWPDIIDRLVSTAASASEPADGGSPADEQQNSG